MKNISAFFILLIVSFSYSSCQKEFLPEDGPPVITPGTTASFTAMVDGVKFTADKAAAATKASGVIAITGMNNAGETIVLRVADSGIRVYQLDISSASNAGAYTKQGEFSYTTNAGMNASQSGGKLSVTSIDEARKTMSGTFSMNVYRQSDQKQVKITDGVFKNIPYETTAVPPANAKDTFRVKVDGAAFPVYSVIAINMYNRISITVNNQATTKTVGITMPSNVAAGSYDFTPFGPDFIGQYNPTSTTYLSASAGKIVIVEHNKAAKRLKGTFHFQAQELMGDAKANLTDGYFSVSYQ